MDPLSDVLSLLKPRSYISGGFEVGGDMAIQFPKHQGIKCYAVLAGQCWLSVEGVPDAVLLGLGTVSFCHEGCPSASQPICHSRLSTSRRFSPHVGQVARFPTMKVGSAILPAGTSFLAAVMPTCCWDLCRPSCI